MILFSSSALSLSLICSSFSSPVLACLRCTFSWVRCFCSPRISTFSISVFLEKQYLYFSQCIFWCSLTWEFWWAGGIKWLQGFPLVLNSLSDHCSRALPQAKRADLNLSKSREANLPRREHRKVKMGSSMGQGKCWSPLDIQERYHCPISQTLNLSKKFILVLKWFHSM